MAGCYVTRRHVDELSEKTITLYDTLFNTTVTIVGFVLVIPEFIACFTQPPKSFYHLKISGIAYVHIYIYIYIRVDSFYDKSDISTSWSSVRDERSCSFLHTFGVQV